MKEGKQAVAVATATRKSWDAALGININRLRNAIVERHGGGKVVAERDGLEGALNSSPNVKAFIELASPAPRRRTRQGS